MKNNYNNPNQNLTFIQENNKIKINSNDNSEVNYNKKEIIFDKIKKEKTILNENKQKHKKKEELFLLKDKDLDEDEKMNKLISKEKESEKREIIIKKNVEELKRIENNYKEKEEELRIIENNNNEKKDEIKKKEENIQEKEEELKKIKNNKKEKEDELKKIEANIKEKEDKLKKIQAYIIEKEDELKKIIQNIKEKEDEIKKKEKNNIEKDHQIKLKEKKIKEKEDELKKIRNFYEEKENELKKIENNNKEKEKEIKIKEKYIKVKEDEFKKRENNNKEKENELKLKEKTIKEKENILLEKENKIIAKKNELSQNENKINIKSNELSQKKIELLQQENDLKNKEKEINKLIEKYKEEKQPIIIGLNNIGATCYMNATLQSLSNTDKLTEYFVNNYKYEADNPKKIMSNEYYKVVCNLWKKENNKGAYSPKDFKEKLSQENPLFAGIAANDSKDLINFLLERLHSELNIIKNDNKTFYPEYVITQNDQLDEKKMLNLFTNEFAVKYNSIISNLFYGLLETKSQCQGCKMIKYNFQVYSFIEFPLERVNQFCFKTGKRANYNMNSNKNPDVDLYECFEYYGIMDLMTGDNQMYCNICNCCCDALYGTLLYSAPNYLIINLNRGKGAIYECKVNFPEQLNLYNFVTFKNGNTVFELYAVICHIGPSSMSGHFVAYCKNKKDKKWYLFNDSMVSPCENSNDYQKGMPYILFYQVLKL